MRPELELTEKIERYLKGEMNPAEKAEFEKQISNDPKLQQEVKLQQDIMNGVSRSALKASAQHAYSKFIKGKNFLKWGSTGLSVIVASTALIYFIAKHHPVTNHFQQPLPELNELGTKQWSDADKYLPAQKFTLNTTKDTVIQTDGGIVMAVPANCFLDANGKPIAGPVELEVKEALDPASIMKAGLSSKSGDKLLESAGMFYVNARKGGQSLNIDPKNGIIAQVPTDTVKSGMQLFQGRRMSDGSIDWVNPKPIMHDLVPVDIHTLNFYPPQYLDTLAKWGYDIKNKAFTDSLYYSYASLFVSLPDSTSHGSTFMPQRANGWYKDTTLTMMIHDTIFEIFPQCGINPAKIKAIWNDQFQKTFIATKEFESRLKYIHQYAYEDLLDLYVNNLDKNLSDIDSMAADMFKRQGMEEDQGMEKVFRDFAKRGDGKVNISSELFARLKSFYTIQSKIYMEAETKTQNEFWGKQKQMDSTAQAKKVEHSNKDVQRMAQNFKEELDSNMEDAYRQIGRKHAFVIAKSGYTVGITNTGWNNLDKYVMESTIYRTTLDYTDPQTGKKAIITYKPVSFEISNYKHYDQVFVYLLPDKLASFMRLNDSAGVFKEKLDGIMTYNMACVAYKDDSIFFYSETSISAKEYKDIQLKPIAASNLTSKLNEVSSMRQQSDITYEAGFIQMQMVEQKRQKLLEEKKEFTFKVGKLLFPCWGMMMGYSEPRTDTTSLRSMLK